MADSWTSALVADCLRTVPVTGRTKIQARDYRPLGRYPVIDQGQERIAGWTDDDTAVISEPLPLIVFGDHTRVFKFVDKPFARGADGTQLLSPKEGIDPLFFFYACRALDLPARGYNRHFTLLKEQTFPYPVAVEEQRAIGAVLHQVELTLEAQSALIRGATQLKHTAMQIVFTQGLRGEPQKETEIGPVPESWRVESLEHFAHFQRGFDITKSTQTEGTIPVVSSGGVRSYHNVAAAAGPGVLIGRKGSIGLLHYVEGGYWPHDTTLWCTDFRGNIPRFVFYRLHSLDFKRLDSGAANPALNRNALHAETISWPLADEQLAIVEILDAIDRKIGLHRHKRGVLDELFQALLHKLMTGEIRVEQLDLSALPSLSVTGGLPA